MKKNIIYAVVATFVVGFLLSFSLVNKNPIHKSTRLNSCGSGVTNLHIVSESGGYVTFAWDGVSSPDHYQWGVYYQGGSNTGGSVYGNTITITESVGQYPGGRFGITAACADGSLGGSQNMLYQ